VVNSGEPRSFSFLRCQELDLSHVEFFGRSATGSSLLRIAGSSRLLIEDCSIFATATANNEKPDFVLQRVPSLAAHRNAFGPTASIDGSLNEAAEAIAALSPAERKKMSSEIHPAAQQRPGQAEQPRTDQPQQPAPRSRPQQSGRQPEQRRSINSPMPCAPAPRPLRWRWTIPTMPA
jgi:hypothetical protein